MINFNCKTKNELWSGIIKRFITHENYYEILIESRSSIYMIIGKTSRGIFACFPDIEVGCHLVDLKDNFWNTEKLVHILGKTDGLTVAAALKNIKNKI